MLALWNDYMLMQRLQCSWPQLQEHPAGLLELFRAFMRGEAAANAQQKLGAPQPTPE